MSIRVEQSSKFRQDVIAVYQYYTEKVDQVLAERFQDSVTATLERLSRNPEIGPLCRIQRERLTDIRYFRVESPFDRHLVFYRLEGELLRAVRLMHGMRDLPRRLKESM